MKKYCIFLAVLISSSLLSANPYLVTLRNFINKTKPYYSTYNAYKLVKFVPVKPKPQGKEGWTVDYFHAYPYPYSLCDVDHTTLQMRDSTGAVLWSKNLNYKNMDNSIPYRLDRDDYLFAKGEILNPEGTMVRLDPEQERYYFQTKNGEITYLPKGTKGLYSRGMVGDKYWLFTIGIGALWHPQGTNGYDYHEKEYFPTGKGWVLFDMQGQVYKQYEFDQAGNIGSFSISPDLKKFVYAWSDDQYTGTKLMNIDGTVIMEYKNSGQIPTGEWSASGDLFSLCGTGTINVIDGNTGEMVASILDGVALFNSNQLSDKAAGIIIHEFYDHIMIINYKTNKLIGTILSTDDKPVQIISISGDGKKIILRDDKGIKTYRMP